MAVSLELAAFQARIRDDIRMTAFLEAWGRGQSDLVYGGRTEGLRGSRALS